MISLSKQSARRTGPDGFPAPSPPTRARDGTDEPTGEGRAVGLTLRA